MARTSPAKVASSKVARTSPARVASSKAGRTSPASKMISNADLNSKARHIAGPLPYVGRLNLNSLRGFRLPIDRAFRDLSEGRIGPLFFIESLFEKTDSIA